MFESDGKTFTTFGKEVDRLTKKHKYKWNYDGTKLLPPTK